MKPAIMTVNNTYSLNNSFTKYNTDAGFVIGGYYSLRDGFYDGSPNTEWYLKDFVIKANDGIHSFKPCKLLSNTTKTWDGQRHLKGECGIIDEHSGIFYGNADNRGNVELIVK